eukprot:5843292-Prorocentrum_lima.AAC.1
MHAVQPWRGAERSMRSERDGEGAGEAGEPVHHLDKEGMDDSEEGGPGGAPLFKTLERVDNGAGGPRV